ncbi:MAG: M48 family metalloprotease [Paracoccaceae bacterium]
MVFERVSPRTSIPAILLACIVTLVSALPAKAISLLRDADIEYALARIAAPVLQAAGLSPHSVKILLVNDSSFNAFVIDSRTIFLNYGLILKVEDAGMLQAVIAHEAAHIQNGHLARRMANFQASRGAAGLGMALAILAAAAGAGEAAGGIALGTQSAASRSFLAHTRAEESSADRSAASYLVFADINPDALIRLHEAFAGQELLSLSRQDPYTRSHPLSRDRMRAAQTFVDANPSAASPDPATEYWFNRARGKISAFTRAPKWTLRRASSEENEELRLMREAIAFHRNSEFTTSLSKMNALLELRPDDPFYYDLLGQILMENRKWSEALSAYEKAVEQAPRNAMVLGGYGRALLANGQPKQAVEAMEKARARDFRDARLLRDLAIGYSKTNQTGMAALVTAERYALSGRLSDAGIHARRAVALLPRGSAAWRRAEDVLIASEQAAKRKGKRKR